MAPLRVTVVGGSGASTPELVDAVTDWPGGPERRPPLELVLQGRSAEKLAVVVEGARSRLPAGVAGVRIEGETDLDRALDGAEMVIVQARVGGLDARIFDETFPRPYGLPGEETMGPGGFANAMRTVPAMAATWDRIALRAPDAFVINLTNPSGIVTQAATAHGGFRAVSVCDAPVTFVDAIAGVTGRDAAAVRLAYAGMNHAGFWVDPEPAILATALPATSGIDLEDLARLSALPTAYLRFYLHPDRQLAAQAAASESRAQVLKRLEARMLDQYATGVKAGQQARRGALWYGVSIVPLIDAMVHGSREPIVLGLPNHGAVPWAPPEAIVELPTDVLATGRLLRRAPVNVPPAAAELLARHARFEDLTARTLAGARSREDVGARRSDLIGSLAANPMVPDAGLAERLVDAILATSPT